MATASATAGFCSPASVSSRQAGATRVTALLPVPKRVGPATGFRDPRRTCARMGFVKGQHPKRVQELLGHSSVAISLDIYSHLIPGLDGEGDPMEEALS